MDGRASLAMTELWLWNFVTASKQPRHCERKISSLRAQRGSPEPEFAVMDGRASLAMTELWLWVAALRSP
jgi:hypothetical protein